MNKLNIDYLISIVDKGGGVKTGIDIFNERGVLLLEKDVIVSDVRILLNIKNNGVHDIPINPDNAGGLWDQNGNQIILKPVTDDSDSEKSYSETDIEKKINEITQLRHAASIKYRKAKGNIKKIIGDIRSSGGQFDFDLVENTVTDLLQFLAKNDNAFSYLTKEIFSFDDYLYNHSINVCTIGVAVLNKFNENFGAAINKFFTEFLFKTFENDIDDAQVQPFFYYLPDELEDMACGFFLHDVGKVLIPDEILNKDSALTSDEYAIVKTHSFEKGIEILERNKLHNAFIKNIAKYHHCALFKDEQNCYPYDKPPFEIPLYVKICKLVDIYDAMTSKRIYKEAINPISVVTEIFRKYAGKDPMLRFILHSFVKVVGIHPPGSIVFLQNGQMAYVIDSHGPLVIPFTDTNGSTIAARQEPIDIGSIYEKRNSFQIDRRKPLISPIDVYDSLPSFIKENVKSPDCS